MIIGAKELAELTGATYRQIDYWTRIGIIKPVGKRNPGSGKRRMFGHDIVERVRTIVRVSNACGHFLINEELRRVYDCYEDGFIALGNGVTLSWTRVTLSNKKGK